MKRLLSIIIFILLFPLLLHAEEWQEARMGLVGIVGGGVPVAGGGPTNGIQLETADFLLCEDGKYLVQE